MKQDAVDYILAIKKELRNRGLQAREGSELLPAGEAMNYNNVPDLVIDTANGKLIVEVKDAKTYGKLPLSTALEMRSLKETNPNSLFIMISLSAVPPPLTESLKAIGINILEKPSVKKAAEAIAGTSYSMSA